MNPVKPYISLVSLLALWFSTFPSVEGKYAGMLPQAPAVENGCQPQILLSHYALPFVDRARAERVPAPRVVDWCTDSFDLACEAQLVELGACGANFSDYFEASRWTVSTNKGDGGVDVTGAPNVLLVEGANVASVNVSPGGKTGMHILIPASGLMTFDCRQVGGSNLFSSQELSVQLNDELRQGEAGHYAFPVRQGDQLSLSFSPDRPSVFQLANFSLHTSAGAVLERVWTVRDATGNHTSATQLISIESPNITDVITPDDRVVFSEDIETALSPEISGYPYLNPIGKSATPADLISLRGQGGAFDISYSDEVQEIPDGLLILRRWRIVDSCSQNRLENSQLIKIIFSSPPPGLTPGGNLIDLSAPRRPELFLPNAVSQRSNEAPDGPGSQYLMTF